jgi:hypothetical protein
MEKLYVIQEVKTKEYYSSYRLDEWFDANINDAKFFNSIEDAEKEINLQKEWDTDLFSNKFLEIKSYYKI